MTSLIKLPEPKLLFGYSQEMEDPRDGLTLFGPLDKGKPYGVRYGIVGTPDGIERMKRYVRKLQSPICETTPSALRPPYPGFQAAFGVPWNIDPAIELPVPESEIVSAIHLDDKHQRVYKAVDVYANRIKQALREEEEGVDIWFVVIPDDVHKYCRPNSFVETAIKIKAENKMPLRTARNLQKSPSLFDEDNQAAIPYQYDVNFHNQLKARLLEDAVLTQVVRESTIAPNDFLNSFGRPARQLDAPSALAWNLSNAVYYKTGGRPWKIGSVRDGVCYIGLVFKQDEKCGDPRSSCCAAQMFLDSGDGVVFKGAVGPWHTPGRGDFHLSYQAAQQLIGIAVDSYIKKVGCPPAELFIHGKVRFNDQEWRGFRDSVPASTNLVGVRIRSDNNLKLYGNGRHPVLRGLAYIRDERTAYLWTKGYIPRLLTYPGMEVPNPLLIDICKGYANIETVLRDILALTKLNYNACIFADGEPVTLKFADSVGEILTAGPVGKAPPLPFKYYI